MVDENKGLHGFKRSEIAGATPEKVFGSDVRIEELPEGIRLYLKERAIDLPTKRMIVNVYRLVDEGGLKVKKLWVGKFINRKPEEDEIAEQFGGGSFVWIAKWLGLEGGERGIISETIEVDEEHGRAAHEEWKRKQGGGAASTPAPSAPPAQVPAPGGTGTDVASILRIMDAAEEKALARMERMANMMKGTQTPSEVLAEAYKGANDMMQKAVDMNLKVAQANTKAQIKALEAPAETDTDAEAEAEGDGPQLPAWLKPFMPKIEAGIEMLLSGGPTANAVKTLVINSDQWKEIFGDKEKWGQLIAAMELQYGSDRTTRALDILLNRRPGAGKKKGK